MSAPSRPKIALSGYPRVVDIVTGPTLLHTASRFYVDSILRAGGIPLVVPVIAPELALDALAAVDGLVLTGGGDISPACYGHEAHELTSGTDPARDSSELALCRAALATGLPMLAICRGAQVLNVALGGTLVADIPSATGARHGWAGCFDEAVHDVRLDPDSRLASRLGGTEIRVNSLHHQAVDVTGTGVTVVGWAPDGTVEAIEVADHPEVVAIQWHPELMEDDDLHQCLFRDLIDRARQNSLTDR